MDRQQLHALLRERVGPRASRLGLRAAEITEDLDLVRTGILDSLDFVDFVTELETTLDRRVELAEAFDKPGVTTVGGVLDLFIRDR